MQAAVEHKALKCVRRFLTWQSPLCCSGCCESSRTAGRGTVTGSMLHAATQDLLRAKHIRLSWMTPERYFSVSLLLGQTSHSHFGIAILDHKEKSAALRYGCQQPCTGFELCCSQVFLLYFSGLKN